MSWGDGIYNALIIDIEPDIKPGDANGDGVINVSDITTVINVITGQGIAAGNADCNGDGSVNVSDITCIINIITGG